MSSPSPEEATATDRPASPSWPAATASLVLTGTTLFLFKIYGDLHWNVIYGPDRFESGLNEGTKAALLDLLATVNYYRVFSLLALAFAIWSFRGRPRWPAWLALAASGLALFVSAIIM